MGLPYIIPKYMLLVGHLPGEEVDEPEGEGVWPHVAQVGQGVQEGHVGSPDCRVRDTGKECHR